MIFEETQNIQTDRSKRAMLAACLIIVAAYAVSIAVLLYNGGLSSFETYYYFPTVTIVLFIVIYAQKITVTVTRESLTITAVSKRIIPIGDIKSVRRERFEKIKWKYGYGAKYNGKKSYVAANADEGVWVELKNGEPFLITSKRSGELEGALKNAMGVG